MMGSETEKWFKIKHLIRQSDNQTTTSDDGGSITPLIMWTTPLDALLSAAVTCFRSLEAKLAPTFTTPPKTVMCNFLPSTVGTSWKAARSVESTFPDTTWYVRMSTNVALFSGFNKDSTVPAGSAANPSFVGANTVNGPAELSVSTKSPATTAATKVEGSLTDSANSTMLGSTAGLQSNLTALLDALLPMVDPFLALVRPPSPTSSCVQEPSFEAYWRT